MKKGFFNQFVYIFISKLKYLFISFPVCLNSYICTYVENVIKLIKPMPVQYKLVEQKREVVQSVGRPSRRDSHC